jgi:hypothetical protein
MDQKTGTCINCGVKVDTPFCSLCGQSNPPKKLTLLTLYTDFQSRIYGFDGMFPRTLRDLTLRPGKVAAAFIGGNRVKYVGPVGYFFLALTMLLLFMELLSVDLYSISKSNILTPASSTQSQETFQKFYVELISRNMRIFTFLLIPFYSLMALAFFRKEKLNILEHSILIFFVTGHVYWFGVINLFLFKFFSINLNLVQLPLQGLLYGIGCIGLYHHGSKTWRFTKGIMVYVTSFILYILFITVASMAYLFSHPELLEQLKKSAG